MSCHKCRGRGKGQHRLQARAGAGQGRAGAGQGRAGQGRAGQGRAGQGRAGQGRAGQGRAGQGRAAQLRSRAGQRSLGAGQGRLGHSSTSTRQDPYHSVRQGIFLVQQDSDEEAVGARVCHVSNAQQGRGRVQHRQRDTLQHTAHNDCLPQIAVPRLAQWQQQTL